jgi:hypothetical protein
VNEAKPGTGIEEKINECEDLAPLAGFPQEAFQFLIEICQKTTQMG